jgi:hypothetical protein
MISDLDGQGKVDRAAIRGLERSATFQDNAALALQQTDFVAIISEAGFTNQ